MTARTVGQAKHEDHDGTTRGVKLGDNWYLDVKQAAARIPRANGDGFVSPRRVRQFIAEGRLVAAKGSARSGYLLKLTDVTEFARKVRSSGVAIKTNGSSE